MPYLPVNKLIKPFFTRLFYLIRPAKYYLSICCIVKDEEEYLEEFITFHLKAGVQYFYLYDNDSKVPVEKILSTTGLSAHTKVIRFPGKGKQLKAYKHCINNFGGSSRWIGFIDMDEFIVAKHTNGNIPKLLKEYEDYASLAVNWQLFGSSHLITKTNELQMKRFILKAEENFHVNRHIKSIIQPKYVKRALDPHRFKYKKGYYAVNENFVPIDSSFSDVSVEKVQINHYHCRSLEEYEEKINRGCADSEKKRSIDEFYHHDAESNEVQDTTILDLFK